MTMTTPPEVGSVLTELRDIIDQREQLAQQDGELSRRKTALEKLLLAFHDASGLDQVAGNGLTVRFDPMAMRCAYDSDRWESIVKWANDTGNLHLIQRRLTDSKVLELYHAGVAFPEGLTLSPYTSISIRRK